MRCVPSWIKITIICILYIIMMIYGALIYLTSLFDMTELTVLLTFADSVYFLYLIRALSWLTRR